MKNKVTSKLKYQFVCISSVLFAFAGCTTYNKIESESVTSALDFEKSDNIAVDVQDTMAIDTAFSEELRDFAIGTLIDHLEDEGFDYVGERNPDLRVVFSTYVTTKAGYVDTTMPITNRIVTKTTVTTRDGRTTTREITTSNGLEPIYVAGPARLFILDVADAKTGVHLWRAYTIVDSTGLDKESLRDAIHRLVERLDEETT